MTDAAILLPSRRANGIAVCMGFQAILGHAKSASSCEGTRDGGPNPVMGKGGNPITGYPTIWQMEVDILLYQTSVGSLCTEPTPNMCAVLF